MYKIIKKEKLNPTVTLIEVEAPFISKKVQAGQFIILRVDEFGERIPLTVANHDLQKGTITLIYQLIGSTTQLLDQLEVNDSILDVVGPLGNPSELPSQGKVCVIAGGVGCAIALPSAKACHIKGCDVDIIAGFRNQDLVILEKEMKEVCSQYQCCTDDGSYGLKGNVGEVLKKNLINAKYDLIIAIGPIVMMRAICAISKEANIKTIVSLNPIMIDGTGMCGGCRVKVDNKTLFACVHGPDFDGSLVDFDDLMVRNTFYRPQEAEHACRLLNKEVYHG